VAVKSLLMRRAVTLPSDDVSVRNSVSAEVVQLHLARSASR
jgi:hypothetical protein